MRAIDPFPTQTAAAAGARVERREAPREACSPAGGARTDASPGGGGRRASNDAGASAAALLLLAPTPACCFWARPAAASSPPSSSSSSSSPSSSPEVSLTVRDRAGLPLPEPPTRLAGRQPCSLPSSSASSSSSACPSSPSLQQMQAALGAPQAKLTKARVLPHRRSTASGRYRTSTASSVQRLQTGGSSGRRWPRSGRGSTPCCRLSRGMLCAPGAEPAP